MKRRMLTALIALLAMATSTTTAFAGPQAAVETSADQAEDFAPRSGPDRGERNAGEEERARKKIEVIRISRLTEALLLDEKTAAKFIPAITALERARRATMREHREAMQELRRQVHGQRTDLSRLKATIERFTASQRDMMKLREQEFETAREHLSTDQLARYLIFQQDFMRELRELVSGMRGNHQGRGGPRRGSGQRPRPVPDQDGQQ